MIRGIRSVDGFPPLHQKSPSLFSNPKSLHDKVPTGWDKLTLSLISIETDKTVTKTGKASVYIMEIVDGPKPYQKESIWISQDDSSKELQQCLYKLLISKVYLDLLYSQF